MRVHRIALALAGASLLFGGCGTADPNERDPDFAKYSAADVRERFKEVTGAELERTPYRTPAREPLRVAVDGDNRGAYERYGAVTVIVTGNEETRDRAQEGRQGQSKTFDNVVVQSSGTDDRSEAAFRRVTAVLASLGKPASAAKLAPEDTRCDKAGIDPDSGDGKEGSCVTDDQKSVRVVNSDGTLELAGRDVSGLRVQTGRVLTERRFGSTERHRSSGRFVVVSYVVENTGDEPLTSLRPELVIDGKRYSEDTSLSFSLRGRDAFPVQPGGRARAVAIFDVPGPAGQEAVEEGALEVPAGEDGYSSVELSRSTGRIRLEGAQTAVSRGASARLSG